MAIMKTTLRLPDEVFRQCKARAAMRGQSLGSFVTEALAAYLVQGGEADSRPPWRALVGAATRRQMREVDAVVEAEFGQVDLAQWE